MSTYLVVLHLDNESNGHALGTLRLEEMQNPVWIRENARILLQTPTLRPPYRCASLREATYPDIKRWRMLREACTEPDDKALIRFQLEHDPADVKFDYVSVQPKIPLMLVWESNAMQIRASAVSIEAEAKGQRLLFVAGAMAGLAGGLIPPGVEVLWHGFRRRPEEDALPSAQIPLRDDPQVVRTPKVSPKAYSETASSTKHITVLAAIVAILSFLRLLRARRLKR